MTATPLAVLGAGLISSVGVCAPASCAAIRAKLTNPTETRFLAEDGDWLMAHEVVLEKPWRGMTKLAKMAAVAIEEALSSVPKILWGEIPMLLCVAEADRPGRMERLDEELFARVEQELGARFAAQSTVIPEGRVSVARALLEARLLIQRCGIDKVLIAATDSLLCWPTLSYYEHEERLLTTRNSNGFMPGEGAGALLVSGSQTNASQLICMGIGLGQEHATISSGEPFRADGLSSAMVQALHEAGVALHEIDLRISDISGEQYYFKEAALALSRNLRTRKEEFDIWHPAESTGEQGAVAGAAIVVLADMAGRRGYAKGANILAHMANDAGQRAALTLQYRGWR